MMRKVPVLILAMLILGLTSCSSGFLSPGGQPGQTPEASMETALPTPTGVKVDPSPEAVEETPEPDPPALPFGVKKYRVGQGDSLFGIANRFGIKPETILFSNSEVLQDEPQTLKQGMELFVPVVDGAVYQWQEGDQLSQVATRFHVASELVVMWAPNQLDYAAYSRGERVEIKQGTIIFIPTGWRNLDVEVPPPLNVLSVETHERIINSFRSKLGLPDLSLEFFDRAPDPNSPTSLSVLKFRDSDGRIFSVETETDQVIEMDARAILSDLPPDVTPMSPEGLGSKAREIFSSTVPTSIDQDQLTYEQGKKSDVYFFNWYDESAPGFLNRPQLQIGLHQSGFLFSYYNTLSLEN